MWCVFRPVSFENLLEGICGFKLLGTLVALGSSGCVTGIGMTS